MTIEQTDAEIPTGLALTPFDPAFAANPHPALDALREREPAHNDEFFHRLVLTRHDDIDTDPPRSDALVGSPQIGTGKLHEHVRRR